MGSSLWVQAEDTAGLGLAMVAEALKDYGPHSSPVWTQPPGVGEERPSSGRQSYNVQLPGDWKASDQPEKSSHHPTYQLVSC